MHVEVIASASIFRKVAICKVDVSMNRGPFMRFILPARSAAFWNGCAEVWHQAMLRVVTEYYQSLYQLPYY